jgi:glycosyltransferase involved in cell wall biosynthesis
LVRGDASASRIQVAADATVAALSRFRRRGARAQSTAGCSRRAIDALLNLGELTVVILTLDEERALPHALASLPPGTRVLVVDAGSRDATVEIARGSGAAVIERAWTDFVDARRFAADAVQTPWTFMLDADEHLDATLRAALYEADPDRDGVDAYRVRRITRFCGAPVHALGWSNERLIRIFRTGRAQLHAHPAAGGAAALHERWETQGRVGEMRGALFHDSYPDRAAYQRKFARYTSLEAEGLPPSRAALALSAALAVPRFLWFLGPRGGLRAGWRGVYLAFWSALYPVAVKRKALRRGAGDA